jgi:hypothetical protein
METRGARGMHATFVRNVCAANTRAAGGVSGDAKRTLHVAQASGWKSGPNAMASQMSSGAGLAAKEIYGVLELLQPRVRVLDRRLIWCLAEDLQG